MTSQGDLNEEKHRLFLDVMSIVVLIAALALGYLPHWNERQPTETPKQR